MSVISNNVKTNKNILFLKGAPDYILKGAKGVLNKDGEIKELNEA
jgi:magnesium-transporting ATPase (P-type)